MNSESRQVALDHEQLPQAGNVEVGDDSTSISKYRHSNRASNPRARSTQRPKPDSSPCLKFESGVAVSAATVTGLPATESLSNAPDQHYAEQFSRWFLIGAAIIAFILILGS